MRIPVLPVEIHTRGRHTSTQSLSQEVELQSEQIQTTANRLAQRGLPRWGLPLPTPQTPTQ